MGQKLQDGQNLEYSSFFLLKGNAGAGVKMKVSKFGQLLFFPLKISLNMTPTNLFLHTMKERLV